MKIVLAYYSRSADEDEQLILSGWLRSPRDTELFYWLHEVPTA